MCMRNIYYLKKRMGAHVKKRGVIEMHYGYDSGTNEYWIRVYDTFQKRNVYQNRTSLGLTPGEMAERMTLFDCDEEHIKRVSIMKPI